MSQNWPFYRCLVDVRYFEMQFREVAKMKRNDSALQRSFYTKYHHFDKFFALSVVSVNELWAGFRRHFLSEAALRHRLRLGTTLALRGWGFKPHPSIRFPAHRAGLKVLVYKTQWVNKSQKLLKKCPNREIGYGGFGLDHGIGHPNCIRVRPE
jgi:hypothetical protein